MSYEIERATPCRVVVTATIGPEEVRSEREHVLGDWLRGARIDGFRKGKAPRALVERRFATEIRDDLEEHLTRRTWDQVRTDEKLRPASPLGIKESGWLDSGEYRFKGEFDVYPAVTLPPLDGFKAPAFDVEPGEDELAGAIEQLRERQAAWEPVAGEPAADGMLVEAEVDGAFPDGDGVLHKSRAAIDEWQTEMQLKPMEIGKIHLFSDRLSEVDRSLTVSIARMTASHHSTSSGESSSLPGPLSSSSRKVHTLSPDMRTTPVGAYLRMRPYDGGHMGPPLQEEDVFMSAS